MHGDPARRCQPSLSFVGKQLTGPQDLAGARTASQGPCWPPAPALSADRPQVMLTLEVISEAARTTLTLTGPRDKSPPLGVQKGLLLTGSQRGFGTRRWHRGPNSPVLFPLKPGPGREEGNRVLSSGLSLPFWLIKYGDCFLVSF